MKQKKELAKQKKEEEKKQDRKQGEDNETSGTTTASRRTTATMVQRRVAAMTTSAMLPSLIGTQFHPLLDRGKLMIRGNRNLRVVVAALSVGLKHVAQYFVGQISAHGSHLLELNMH